MINAIISLQSRQRATGISVPQEGYTLQEQSVTSAGVYDSEDNLLRTLWSNVIQEAGEYDTPNWNGLDDDGNAVSGSYIKVVSNNVEYEWEGIIGNTSNTNGGPTVHQNFHPINGMIQVGNYMYQINNFNEDMPAFGKFHIDSPNIKIKILTSVTYGIAATGICSDGANVYIGGYDPWRPNDNINFVFGINPANDSQRSFSSGSSYTTISNRSYSSIITRRDGSQYRIKGMAVQPSGDYLFVSRANGTIDVYNKTTGASVRTISMSGAGKMVCYGSDIWVISDAVRKYTVNGDGTLSSATVTLTGLVLPTNLSVSSTGLLAVTDESTSQQVKIFNQAGVLQNTLGTAGGYNSSPEVSTSKLFLTNNEGNDGFILNAYTAFQGTKLWVGDAGNYRNLRYSDSLVYEDQIAYTGFSRSIGVDPHNPQRVFCNYLEYEVDYNQPLSASSGWVLKRNWSKNVPLGAGSEYHRLKWVNTLTASGKTKTYAFEEKQGDDDFWVVVELVPESGIRYTGIEFPKANNHQLMYNGSIRTFTDIQTNQPSYWTDRPLTAIDSSNNPVWGTGVVRGNTPAADQANSPVFRPFVGWNFPPNDDTDNMLISFEGGVPDNPSVASSKYHLGGVRKGSGQWAFRTAIQTGVEYDGPYPNDGRYDNGNDTNYPGGIILCKEKSIFWGHHGEFWKQMQTNKYHHVHECGLLVGVFGQTGSDPAIGGGTVWENRPYPGMAGNALKGDIVKIGSDYYIYHCDEGHHSGVHRWKVSGLNTMIEHDMNL